MKKFFSTLILTLGCAGCSTLPNSQAVSSFGDAAATSTALLKNAVSTNQLLNARIDEEIEASKYISNGKYKLLDSTGVDVLEPDLQLRINLLIALQDYSAALKSAADQGVIDGLRQAAANLGAAASKAAVIASPASAPIAGPVITVISMGAGYLLGNAYAGEIQMIIQARDPDVQEAVKLLEPDLETILDFINLNYATFRTKRQESLNAVRAGATVDRLRLYNEYKNARQDVSAIAAQVKSLSKYKELLEGLAKAHHALAVNSPDAQAELNAFLAIATSLGPLVQQIK